MKFKNLFSSSRRQSFTLPNVIQDNLVPMQGPRPSYRSFDSLPNAISRTERQSTESSRSEPPLLPVSPPPIVEEGRDDMGCIQSVDKKKAKIASSQETEAVTLEIAAPIAPKPTPRKSLTSLEKPIEDEKISKENYVNGNDILIKSNAQNNLETLSNKDEKETEEEKRDKRKSEEDIPKEVEVQIQVNGVAYDEHVANAGIEEEEEEETTEIEAGEVAEVEEDNIPEETTVTVENVMERFEDQVPTENVVEETIESKEETTAQEIMPTTIVKEDTVEEKVVVMEEQKESAELEEEAEDSFSSPPPVPDSTKAMESVPNKKKKGVSGESSRTMIKSSKDLVIPCYKKDADSNKLITLALKRNLYLTSIMDTGDIVQSIVDAMTLRTVPKGTQVIKEGENGFELYVSAKGKLEVLRDGKHLNYLEPGTAFGEIAIMYSCKRNATIIALTDCSLWVIERKYFHKIMIKDALSRTEEHIEYLRTVPILANLDRDVLQKMADILKQEHYVRGNDIIREGEEGNEFYMITMGKVKVSIAQEDGSQLVVSTLGKGDFFGERALINDDVRKATVTASSDTECLVLGRPAFKELLGDLEVLKQAAASGKARSESSTSAAVVVEDEFQNMKLDELRVIATLGAGGFGRVELVRHSRTSTTYALKILKKIVVVERGQQEHAFNEKNIMMACRSPFIARLYRTFRDNKYLFLLMEPCMGGDVWSLLQKYRTFPEPAARFMVACVVEGFEYLHTRGIVYRDLKPENLMLDTKGYVKLVDFGFAKKIGLDNKTWTFAGTPEYLAPEVIKSKGHDRAADYWSLGIFIHELLAGRPPFRGGEHEMKLLNAISRGIENVDFPHTIPKTAQFLIRQLCKLVPTERLGYKKGGIISIKQHRWFNKFDWEALQNTTMKADIIPRVADPADTRNFDKIPKDKYIPPDDLSGWDIDF